MADDPRAARLQEQMQLERVRHHQAMNRAQAEIQRLQAEVRDYRIQANNATREMTNLRRELLELRNQPANRNPQLEREELESKLKTERMEAETARNEARRLREATRLLENELLLLATDSNAARVSGQEACIAEPGAGRSNTIHRVGMIGGESAQALTGAPVAGKGPYPVLAHVLNGQAIRLLIDMSHGVDGVTVPVDRFAKLSKLEEQRAIDERVRKQSVRALVAALQEATERLRRYENAEIAQTVTEGVPEANPYEKNPDGFYRIGAVGTDVEVIISDTAEIPTLDTVEHTGKGGFVDTNYGMTIAGIDGGIHPIYGEFKDGFLFRVVIDLTEDFRRDGLLSD
ncbi:hypothetical protein CGLAUT_05645 [Corynebacterium glaucum]|uniref:hypothetical protein n=1 Tax=Corynebacterium glaucum TaxID=187491 RepID=UPI0025B35815|nr:hypothetical protein [Corynebacterium glaucum]WJZ07623.1 hypothetical protein CGLAUT_05645 [Corynebacterium glaucum]